MAATAFETYKAQADVLVPLVKALIGEIGLNRTHTLVSDALRGHFLAFGTMASAAVPAEKFSEKIEGLLGLFGQDEAISWEVEKKTDDQLDFRVTNCKYAEMYKKLGAPELGFLLCCSQDYPFTEGLDEAAFLERPTTLMQGGSHCQFSWGRKGSAGEAQIARDAESVRAIGAQREFLAGPTVKVSGD